jgi:hypothetical protein
MAWLDSPGRELRTYPVDAAVASALDELAGLDPVRAEMFELRVHRWWSDLRDGLAGVYGERADELAGRSGRTSGRSTTCGT